MPKGSKIISYFGKNHSKGNAYLCFRNSSIIINKMLWMLLNNSGQWISFHIKHRMIPAHASSFHSCWYTSKLVFRVATDETDFRGYYKNEAELFNALFGIRSTVAATNLTRSELHHLLFFIQSDREWECIHEGAFKALGSTATLLVITYALISDSSCEP